MFHREAIILGVLCGAFLADILRADDWSPLWTTSQLSEGCSMSAATAAGGKIFIAGGGGAAVFDTVYAYDTISNTWSTSHLSSARSQIAATTVGSKVLFGGGLIDADMDGIYVTNVVDIYDVTTNTWSTATLSQGRTAAQAASVGDRSFFGGGSYGYFSNVVDIYNVSTNSWSTTHLSQPRWLLAAASADNKVLFGGGMGYPPTDSVDIFDATTDTWSIGHLSVGRAGLTATSVGGKVFFAGGNAYAGGTSFVASNVVDIFDSVSGQWSSATLSQARAYLSATSAGGKAFFAGGYSDQGRSDRVDIYDVTTNTWSTTHLSQPRDHLASAATGNKVLFAGGSTGSSNSNIVDIYTIQDYPTITSSKAFTLVDKTTVTGRMQLNTGASLNVDGYDLSVGAMAGVAPINLSTHTLTTGSDNTDSAYSGAISGSGSLIKTGSGVLALSGANSYLGSTTISAGELDLVGADAWNPITNLGGAYLSGGELVFDYAGGADPYTMILGLLNTKISGSMPLTVVDDTVNDRVIVSLVPEPSALLLAATGLLGLLGYA